MLAPTVFISYSHKDEIWRDRLVTHLAVLQNEGLLQTWTDRDIGAGNAWFEEIRKAMDSARVAVLLISANSLSSQFILNEEVPRLLERLAVFPVICGDCVWQEVSWLAKLNLYPRDGKPLASFKASRRDSELAKITREILKISRDGASPSKPDSPISSGDVTRLSALHQLPSPPADFVGREEDISALKSALSGGGTGAIFGLRGMGGVGKTTLALKLAEELTPLYPDAQFYLDLKGVDPQPLSPMQAMAHVVRAFNPEASLPESETEMAALYRTVLHGNRALLLMDNAANREQVEPLIPPSGSLLLVTSRVVFTLPGMVSRDLDELPEKDARALLLRIASRIGSGADEIARLCGCLPQALRLAGGTLAERPNLSPSDYARRLREGKEKFGPVEASLNLSYELLKEGLRRLWRLLAVFPGTFNAEAAAAVWEVEIDPAMDALSELVRNSLVEWEEKEERYRLHDLARGFADRRIEPAERDLAQRWHAEHFLEVIRKANDLYENGGEFVRRGLLLFDTEWENIQTGQAWTANHFRENDTAAGSAMSIPGQGTSFSDCDSTPGRKSSGVS